MYTWLLKNIVMPIGEVIQGTTILSDLRFLEESQWWSPTELKAWQEERLRILIQHAYDRVPYYRRVFHEMGLSPEDIKTVEDLQKLPTITKDDIRRDYSQFLSEDFAKRRAVLRSTGGTTGKPLQYYMDVAAQSLGNACVWRGWGYAGYTLGDKMATLAGSSLVPNRAPPLAKRVFGRLQRNHPLSAVHMSDEIMRNYATTLERLQPEFIRGYPTALAFFAEYLQKERIASIRPRAVFTTAETLMPTHRELIEKIFRCRVFDGYGCGDGGVNAMECSQHHGHHVSVERAVLEVVRNGSPAPEGEIGEIVLTDLHNFAMPFIRYRVGDVGALSGTVCACGRGLPLLARIEGRTTDIMVFEGGVSLSGPAATLIFKGTHFRHYQLVQASETKLLVRVVPAHQDTDAHAEDMNHVENTLKAHLPQYVQMEWEFVDEIPVSSSGKRRFFISRAGSEYGKERDNQK